MCSIGGFFIDLTINNVTCLFCDHVLSLWRGFNHKNVVCYMGQSLMYNKILHTFKYCIVSTKDKNCKYLYR